MTNEKIRIYRILDSEKERFKLTGPFQKRIDVINIITAPEIEMLIIHAENKYDDYKRKRLKPSQYVKQYLKISDIKRYNFIKSYFADVNKLKISIRMYHQKAAKKTKTLLDLLK